MGKDKRQGSDMSWYHDYCGVFSTCKWSAVLFWLLLCCGCYSFHQLAWLHLPVLKQEERQRTLLDLNKMQIIPTNRVKRQKWVWNTPDNDKLLYHQRFLIVNGLIFQYIFYLGSMYTHRENCDLCLSSYAIPVGVIQRCFANTWIWRKLESVTRKDQI